jgi:hypothetical protein
MEARHKTRKRRKRRIPVSERIAYDVPEAGALLGLGRNSSYAAAKSGAIPTIPVNGRLIVPKAQFHALYGSPDSTAVPSFAKSEPTA